MSSKKVPRNKCVTDPHISERKLGALPRLFCADVTAPSAASLMGLNRKHGRPLPRHAGSEDSRGLQDRRPPPDGEAEADEGHFGARHARGRGARGKTIVFGPLRRGGRVCT